MKIAKELAKQARQFDICQEWHDELKMFDNKSAMIQMYLKGINFCLANDYPSNKYIQQYFGDIINDFGIFLDSRIDLASPRNCVVLGTCTGLIEINSFNVSHIYVKHNSELTIVAKENAFAIIDVFDNSIIHVKTHDNSKIFVYQYGMSVVKQEVFDFSKIKVTQKTYLVK
jgi:hypothetical protein